jgi:hypothetical protein
MPTHAHSCPPMNNNIAPMPTQNPWAWVGMGMGMGTLRRALVRDLRMQWSRAFSVVCEVPISVTCIIVSLKTMLKRMLEYTNG